MLLHLMGAPCRHEGSGLCDPPPRLPLTAPVTSFRVSHMSLVSPMCSVLVSSSRPHCQWLTSSQPVHGALAQKPCDEILGISG